MKNIFKGHISTASAIVNNSERLTYLTSVLRSLLQLTVVTSFELIRAQTPADEIDLKEFTNRFCKPSDGLPLEILDSVIPFLRCYVNKQYMNGWFEPTSSVLVPLNKQLMSWVQFRNKRTGHGILDRSTTKEWAERTEELIKACLDVFDLAIPVQDDESSIKLSSELNHLYIETPILQKGKAVVITSIVTRKGIWKLRGQLLSLEDAEEFTINLPQDNVFSIESVRSDDTYKIADIISNNKEYSFFHNIPVRQTDTFEGRQAELATLAEWMDDEDSRYCLIFGDGGYGKTTLVLELFNSFMEDQYDFKEPLPTIISYHTAKKTKWTEEGLVHFSGISTAMDECIRELMRYFYPVLPKEWYAISGRQLIDKAVGVLKENKLSRDDILLILDNTETLATSPQEVKDLGAFFKVVGKKVGRIIITSRRREFIEATPIIVEGLSEAESISLMQKLATEYNALPILQAGNSKLRKISKQLMQKPILLETLVKYISRSNFGIDAAIDNIFRKSNEELLEFLYEDAWVRMNDVQQKVFLVLVHIMSPLDQYSVSQVCQEVGIQISDFQSSLVETHFASLTDYGRTYTLELVDLAEKFFLQQFSKLNADEKKKLKGLATSVDSNVLRREAIEKEYKADRVGEAFRNEFAKSAKIHVEKGDISGAIELYKLAIEDDPLNSALHDRFAWLLFNKTQDLEYAERMALKAIELDPHNCDALVDAALIYYRLRQLSKGDEYIDKARQEGRPFSFCLLRKAIARYHYAKNETNLNRSIAMLEYAQELLKTAENKNDKNHGYGAKNLQNIKKYQDLVRAKLTPLKAKRTMMLNRKMQ